jgi:protocatechuate 3,4-dioxygenase beta subunit
MRFALCFALFLPLVAQSPGCLVEGRVSNLLSGGPVRRAKVLMGAVGDPKYSAVTDVNGHYTISGIAPGRYLLWVQRPGFLPSYYGARGPNRAGKSLLVAAGETRKDVNFFLEPPGVITGHIYDQEGEPLSTSVLLFREYWHNGHKRYQQAGGAGSDDEGQYRLFGLPAGTYVVCTAPSPVHPASPVPAHEIYPPTFYPSTEDMSGAVPLRLAAGGEARDIDIRVRKAPSLTVSGTVNPDPGLRIVIQRRDGFPVPLINVMFPQPGQFAAHGLTPGAYTLTAKSNASYARMDLDIGSRDMDGVEIRLAPLINVPGVVKFEGDKSGASQVSGMVSKERQFEWKGLTPGDWALDFVPKLPGFYLKSPAGIEIGPEGHVPVEVVISSRGASVQGMVRVSAEHPDPVESATVLLVAEEEKTLRVVRNAVTRVDGAYSFTRIPPGKYRLVALEDVELNSWDNPDVARTYEGKGSELVLGEGQAEKRDLNVNQ